MENKMIFSEPHDLSSNDMTITNDKGRKYIKEWG